MNSRLAALDPEYKRRNVHVQMQNIVPIYGSFENPAAIYAISFNALDVVILNRLEQLSAECGGTRRNDVNYCTRTKDDLIFFYVDSSIKNTTGGVLITDSITSTSFVLYPETIKFFLRVTPYNANTVEIFDLCYKNYTTVDAEEYRSLFNSILDFFRDRQEGTIVAVRVDTNIIHWDSTIMFYVSAGFLNPFIDSLNTEGYPMKSNSLALSKTSNMPPTQSEIIATIEEITNMKISDALQSTKDIKLFISYNTLNRIREEYMILTYETSGGFLVDSVEKNITRDNVPARYHNLYLDPNDKFKLFGEDRGCNLTTPIYGVPLSFHTHPLVALKNCNHIVSWPSDSDMTVAFWYDIVRHYVVASEGVYAISITPAFSRLKRYIMGLPTVIRNVIFAQIVAAIKVLSSEHSEMFYHNLQIVPTICIYLTKSNGLDVRQLQSVIPPGDDVNRLALNGIFSGDNYKLFKTDFYSWEIIARDDGLLDFVHPPLEYTANVNQLPQLELQYNNANFRESIQKLSDTAIAVSTHKIRDTIEVFMDD